MVPMTVIPIYSTCQSLLTCAAMEINNYQMPEEGLGSMCGMFLPRTSPLYNRYVL